MVPAASQQGHLLSSYLRCVTICCNSRVEIGLVMGCPYLMSEEVVEVQEDASRSQSARPLIKLAVQPEVHKRGLKVQEVVPAAS